MQDSEQLEALRQQVLAAAAQGRRLQIQGHASKRWLQPQAAQSQTLELGAWRGISSYEPTELVVTARAGTPLAELEAVLAEQGQCLPFEAPRFARDGAPGASVGGMLAAGLSGPGRLGAGGVRDYVLGVSLLNGRGEVLQFGGQVMKNVAGFDVSRMLAGSMGSLGAMLEVSLKVLPVAPAEATLVFEMDQAAALLAVNRWGGQPLPISASSWSEAGLLHLRLRGAAAAVNAAQTRLGGQLLDAAAAAAHWDGLREQSADWFAPSWQPQSGLALWRLAVPATAPVLDLPGTPLIEWGGAQRWLLTDAPAAQLREASAAVGGHATRWRAQDASVPAFSAPSPVVARIQRQLKLAFDPHAVFPDFFAAA